LTPLRDGDGRLRAVRSDRGFTLIELSIVVFIIAIVAGIAIPRLRDVSGVELTSTTRRLSNTVRYVYEEAALRGLPYALVFDLDAQTYWVSMLDPETGEYVADDSLLSRKVALPDGVRVVDVILPVAGKVAGGLAPTHFYPEGFADESVIHLADQRDHAYTLRIDPVRGRGEVYEGYKEFEITAAEEGA
jgi:general secretion pathway protein H